MLIVLAALFCIAFANGANDVSRAAASLLGGGALSYRRALVLVLCCTFAGSLLSAGLAFGVAQQFAESMHSAGLANSSLISTAILIGACAWVLLATQRGVPVATTHALLGSLVGVALVSGGWQAFLHLGVGRRFVLPLVTSPLLAFLGVVVLRGVQRLLIRGDTSKSRAFAGAHLVSAGLLALTRGVNDSAKIWGVALPSVLASKVPSRQGTMLLVLTAAVAMALGGAAAGRRVTESIAFRITAMDPLDGLMTSFVSFLLIGGVSLLGFPVASSHIVGGATIAIGATDKRHRVNRQLVGTMLLGWVLTLPAASILGGSMLLLGLHRAAWPWAAVAVMASSLVYALVYLRENRHSATKLLIFVCSGNTSRSPMAAALCRHLLKQKPERSSPFLAISRGLSVKTGEPMTSLGRRTLNRLGIFDAIHYAAPLTADDVRRAYRIFCMTGEQCQTARERFPEYSAKIMQLHVEDVPNPAAGDETTYQHLAETLIHGIKARLTQLSLPNLA